MPHDIVFSMNSITAFIFEKFRRNAKLSGRNRGGERMGG